MAKIDRICSIPECGNPVHIKSRGLCQAHYMRWVRYRDPVAGGPMQTKAPFGAPRKFLDAALEYAARDCLVWPFATDTDGYGVIKIDGRLRNVHRVICERAHGPSPTPKHEAAHDNFGRPCISEACVNPRHLRWATRTENEHDKRKHSRAA